MAGQTERHASGAMNFTELKVRYQADTGFGGSGAVPALARALERIGWRAVRDPSPEELAGYLAELIDACVHEHRDLAQLSVGMASTLRACGPQLDGGLPPVEAYLPAADEVLRRYVKGDRSDPPAPPVEEMMRQFEPPDLGAR